MVPLMVVVVIVCQHRLPEEKCNHQQPHQLVAPISNNRYVLSHHPKLFLVHSFAPYLLTYSLTYFFVSLDANVNDDDDATTVHTICWWYYRRRSGGTTSAATTPTAAVCDDDASAGAAFTTRYYGYNARTAAAAVSAIFTATAAAAAISTVTTASSAAITTTANYDCTDGSATSTPTASQ